MNLQKKKKLVMEKEQSLEKAKLHNAVKSKVIHNLEKKEIEYKNQILSLTTELEASKKLNEELTQKLKEIKEQKESIDQKQKV